MLCGFTLNTSAYDCVHELYIDYGSKECVNSFSGAEHPCIVAYDENHIPIYGTCHPVVFVYKIPRRCSICFEIYDYTYETEEIHQYLH